MKLSTSRLPNRPDWVVKHWLVCCTLTLRPSFPQGEAKYMWTFHPAAQDQTYSMWETPLETLHDNKPIHDPTGRPPTPAPGDVWSAKHKGRVWGGSPWDCINNTSAELISHWLPNLVNVSSPNLKSIRSHNTYLRRKYTWWTAIVFSCLSYYGTLKTPWAHCYDLYFVRSPNKKSIAFYILKALVWKSIATSKRFSRRFVNTFKLTNQHVNNHNHKSVVIFQMYNSTVHLGHFMLMFIKGDIKARAVSSHFNALGEIPISPPPIQLRYHTR